MSENKNAGKAFGLDDTIDFKCGPEHGCFTACCADVTIFLNPYDVLRMSERLGMDSTAFLRKHTVALQGSSPVIPLVVLKMDEEKEGKPCPFVGPEGCTVYEDRPWSCRLYPLDSVGNMLFDFLDVADRCQGIGCGHKQTVKDYLTGQDLGSSFEMDHLYAQITNHPKLPDLDVDNPKIAQMIYLAVYDLDLFRRLILESSFLDKFDVPEERIKAIETDKRELLKFGIDWVLFGLFAEKTLAVKPEAADNVTGE